MPLVILLAILLTSCAAPPPIDVCTIVNRNVALCVPNMPEKPEYDKDTVQMIGYQCMSPDDTGKIKKYLRRLLDN